MRPVIYTSTLGVTQPALTAFRNELAARYDHEIMIIEVPAKDAKDGEHVDAYGLAIADKTADALVLVGDGFRGDNQGEGGAGHRSVRVLLALFGFVPDIDILVYDEPVDFRTDTITGIWKLLAEFVLRSESGYYKPSFYQVPSKLRAQYIDNAFLRPPFHTNYIRKSPEVPRR